MKHTTREGACGSTDHVSRRTLIKGAVGAAGLAWLTPVAQWLSRADEGVRPGDPARSVIVLWLEGGPSQLETFDPHPGRPIAFGTKAIPTSIPDVQLAEGLEQVAEVLENLSLIRSVVSKEADHERAVYNMKTGYRPNPTVVHPSLGAVICHELPDQTVEIPRHISILPGEWPARGGYLGARYDAFQTGDPEGSIPDVTPTVSRERIDRRLRDLSVVENAFAKERRPDLESSVTLHRSSMERALKIMDSDQLDAFDVRSVPTSRVEAFGDTAFGRGCLAAARLIETGVRCVEVTLGGWDTHVNNHELQRKRVGVLDAAFAALVRDLKERDLFDSTIVLCGGEFGRTPRLNPLEGRDHWPYGFSVAIGGGGIVGGKVIGATDPEGESREPDRPVGVRDVHATLLRALGIDSEKQIQTPVGRPIALSEGFPIRELLRT